MPCIDYESDDWGRGGISPSDYKRLKNQADLLARIACKAMYALENDIPLNDLMEDTEIAKWWPAHKKADAARQKKEAEEKAKKAEEGRLRKEALAKLTPEEIEAFGLNKKSRSKV